MAVWLCLMVRISSCSFSMAACFCARESSFFSMASSLRSMFSSFCCRRRSCFCCSARRSLTSFSYSLRFFKISSFASRSASLFLFSELLMASLTIRRASCSASSILRWSFFSLRRRISVQAAKPRTRATANERMATIQPVVVMVHSSYVVIGFSRRHKIWCRMTTGAERLLCPDNDPLLY